MSYYLSDVIAPRAAGPGRWVVLFVLVGLLNYYQILDFSNGPKRIMIISFI